MLCGEHHGIDALGAPIFVPQGDLRLGVGTQPRHASITAQKRLPLYQAMRKINRRGHQYRRLIAGIAKHQPLVARPLIEVVILGGVHPLGDIRALLVIGHEHGTALVINAVIGVVVPNVLNRLAGDLNVINVGLGRDLASEHHQTRVTQSLCRDAGPRVLGQDSIEHSIGDLVRDLVRVAFGDRLRGKEIVLRHSTLHRKDRLRSL